MSSEEPAVLEAIEFRDSPPQRLSLSEGCPDFVSEDDGLGGRQWIAGNPGSDAQMLIELINLSQVLHLDVRRPILWTATIVKRTGDESLGLDMKYVQEGGGLVVDNVVPGAVQRWNEGHPEATIERFDRIVSVNGRDSSPSALAEGIKGTLDQNIVLVMSRPPPDLDLAAVQASAV